jgi:deoxycytidylate deaminase
VDEYRALKFLAKKLKAHKTLETKNQHKKYFVGALALDSRSNPVCVGFNSYTKSHPYQKKLSERISIENIREKIYLHAEISALIRCKGEAETLIVARIGVDDNIFRLARPCPICQEAIRQSGIKKVYFTNDQGELVLMDQNPKRA